MSTFKRERVLFHIIGQGEVEVEYEAGAETPEQAFRRAYDESINGITKLMIVGDVEFVTTVATEPMQDPDWESRINWTNRSDVELAHHLASEHDIPYHFHVNRTEMNGLHDRAHEMADERERDEYARAREDEADQWRMNR